MDSADEHCVADCIDVLCDVRRVARALEADRRASASRAPRILSDLHDTLDLFAAIRYTLLAVIASLQYPQVSTAGEGKALLQAQKILIHYEESRKLSEN